MKNVAVIGSSGAIGKAFLVSYIHLNILYPFIVSFNMGSRNGINI